MTDPTYLWKTETGKENISKKKFYYSTHTQAIAIPEGERASE
jgi:hypothetical protein